MCHLRESVWEGRVGSGVVWWDGVGSLVGFEVVDEGRVDVGGGVGFLESSSRGLEDVNRLLFHILLVCRVCHDRVERMQSLQIHCFCLAFPAFWYALHAVLATLLL